MSVILDALQKARRDSTRDAAALGMQETRALDGAHRSVEPRRKSRRGLLVLVVLGSVGLTLFLCAGAFYLLALRLGVIPRGWPVTAITLPGGTAPSVGSQVLGADGKVVLVGTPTEIPGWDGGAAAGTTVSAPGASVPAAAVSPNAPLPTPAPLSAAASHAQGGATTSPALPPPADLPLTVQPPGQSPVPAAPLAVSQPTVATTVATVAPQSPLAPAPAATPALTVGTILCDETGCTAAVNGRTVRVGDVILDYTVMAVTADKVTVQRAGEAPLVLRPRM